MRYLSLLVVAAAVMFASGCGEKKPVLHVFNWDDYLNPELITRFEEENGCQVVVDIFDSNESMLAKLKSGASGYDILVPSSYMVKVLEREGMILPLDHAKIPNLKNIDDVYLTETAFDKEMKVSVPYMMAPTVIAYIDGKVENPTASWHLLERPELKGRITILNDARETIGAALKALGYSLNTVDPAQLEEAKQLVIKWKQNIAKFESDQYNAGIASEEFLMVHGYAGDLFQAQEENEKVVIVVPEEGTSISCDDLVIPTDAPNPDLAYAFINFLCDAEVAAENTEYIYYLAPNKAAYELLSDEIKGESAIFIDPVVRGKSEMIDDLGPEGNGLYNAIWDQIKSAPVE